MRSRFGGRLRAILWASLVAAALAFGPLATSGHAAPGEELSSAEGVSAASNQQFEDEANRKDIGEDPDLEGPSREDPNSENLKQPEEQEGPVRPELESDQSGQSGRMQTRSGVAPLADEPDDADAADGISCKSGYMYSLQRDGALYEVTDTGAVEKIGDPAAGQDSKQWNALGVGAHGSPVYALRFFGTSTNNRSVYLYEFKDGEWQPTPLNHPQNPSENNRFYLGSVVVPFAGAATLDPCNPAFYFGAYSDSSVAEELLVWKFADGDAGKAFTVDLTYPAGQNWPAIKSGETGNGDFAFDSAGNLYIVKNIQADDGYYSGIYSVSAETLKDAEPGETITPTSFQGPLIATQAITGIAFDATGHLYAGGTSWILQYNMENWAAEPVEYNKQDLNLSGNWSVDLASCSSPPSILLQKDLPLGRFEDGQQFELEITELAEPGGEEGEKHSATTEGPAKGLQKPVVGPILTVPGQNMRISEAAPASADGAVEDDYVSTWECESRIHVCDQGEPAVEITPLAKGVGTSAEITIPTEGAEDVECTFTNIPRTAKVILEKAVLEVGDTDPKPGGGWELTADIDAGETGATVIAPDPAVSTQTTPSDGDTPSQVEWEIKFPRDNGPDATVTVDVSEKQKIGYLFEEGRCTTYFDDEVMGEPVEIEDGELKGLELKQGQTLKCSFLNAAIPSLQLCKNVKAVEPALSGLTQVPAQNWSLEGSRTGADPAEDYEGTPAEGESCVTRWIVKPGTYNLKETLAAAQEDQALANAYKPVPASQDGKTGPWECWAVPFEEGMKNPSGPTTEEPWEERELTNQTSDGTATVEVNGVEGTVADDADAKVRCEVTNQAAELTILKKTEGEGAEPSDFTVKAIPTDTELEGGLPSLEAAGSAEVSGANTLIVLPGHDYELSEVGDAAFLFKSFEKYVPSADQTGTPKCPVLDGTVTPPHGEGACWETVASECGDGVACAGTTVTADEPVSVAQGERAIYRFTNVTPEGPDLPVTGGRTATWFFVLAGVVAVVSFGLFKRSRR